MEYVTLGKTGLRVSRMGLGGIPIQKIDAEGTKTLLHKLADQGVNYIDTARGYTVSEEYLGYALEGIRDRFIIATKSMARTKEAMAEDIEKSLHNLRTDHIELYQVHNPSMEQLDQVQAAGGALEALQEARAAGKIEHIGLTAHSVEVFARALELDWVETIMFPYNIVESQGEELISKCEEKNIGFIDMKPLAGGAIENGTLALRYVCSNKNVTIVIPGMAEEKEIEENIKACLDDSPLSEKELEEVQTVRNQLGTNFCRRCNYCAPCSVGIDISGVFLFAGYLNRYGLGDWARNRVTEPGEQYQNLNETYVVFITENDVLGENIPIYHVDRIVRETGKMFNDQSHIIYVNSQIKDETALGKLMHDFTCTNAKDMYYEVLADRVHYFKEDEKGVAIMCKAMEDMRNEAAREAEKMKAIRMARLMIEDGKLNYEDIAMYTELTLEEVEKIALEKKSA